MFDSRKDSIRNKNVNILNKEFNNEHLSRRLNNNYITPQSRLQKNVV